MQFINNPTLQNQNIEFVPSSSKIQYFIEEKWFQRIIENLLANAIKHNNETTNVIVNLSQNENFFTLSISDNGKGMDEKRKGFYLNGITGERIQKKVTSELDLASPLRSDSFMFITGQSPLKVKLEKERRLFLCFRFGRRKGAVWCLFFLGSSTVHEII